MRSTVIPFTISGYSTARYATWFFIDELALLLDAGDGLVAGLLQKAAKVKTVAISHADRDHLSGLLHFLQLYSSGERPLIGYPESSGSFPALANFSGLFDPQQGGKPTWLPLHHGMEMPLNGGMILRASVNRHIPCEPGQTKSLSYAIVHKARKLKVEYLHLSGPEIGALHARLGQDTITDETEETLLVYTADTPIEPASRWGKTRILIHEATFLDRTTAESRGQFPRHSVLSDVLEMVATQPPEILILTHFSTRYSVEQIREQVQLHAVRLKLPCRIHAILPGETVHDLLRQTPMHLGM